MKYLSTIKKRIIEQARSLDKGMMYAAFILLFCGVFLTLAASPAVAARNNLPWLHFIIKHMIFVPVAFGVLMGVALLPLKWVRRVAFLILIGAMGGMLLALLGPEIKGAHRWINVFGFSVQPSEFVKPAFAVVCGWLLARGRLIKHCWDGWIAWVICGMVVLLLLAQPDIGMTLTILSIFAVELFLSGISIWLVSFLILGGIGFGVMAFLTFEHVHNRVIKFLFPEEGTSYQVEKSMETLKNAGWFGKGPGEGSVKYELPDAHTDFIMAVSAEEFGFIITALIVMTFAFIMLRSCWLIRRENNFFVQVAVGGLMTQITVQSLVNILSTLNLIPTKGMTLPFISYGGSSLVSVAFAFGFILALTHGHSFSRGLE
jgi:cell division protein FtsW